VGGGGGGGSRGGGGHPGGGVGGGMVWRNCSSCRVHRPKRERVLAEKFRSGRRGSLRVPGCRRGKRTTRSPIAGQRQATAATPLLATAFSARCRQGRMWRRAHPAPAVRHIDPMPRRRPAQNAQAKPGGCRQVRQGQCSRRRAAKTGPPAKDRALMTPLWTKLDGQRERYKHRPRRTQSTSRGKPTSALGGRRRRNPHGKAPLQLPTSQQGGTPATPGRCRGVACARQGKKTHATNSPTASRESPRPRGPGTDVASRARRAAQQQRGAAADNGRQARPPELRK